MTSDNYDFYYNSSQDYFDIEYQIDLFEIRQCLKAKKQRKQKTKKYSVPLSKKTLKCQPTSIKIKCKNDQRPSKIDRSKKLKIFECDQQFETTSTSVQSHFSLKTERSLDFSTFRSHFYHIYHQQIKSSLKNQSNIKIVNLRLAPIDELVQNDFMKKFNENKSYYPYLVYHGTTLNNIGSILRYGFLIPNRNHPTNPKAPIITSKNGSSYGTGIYCSTTADYSLSYTHTTTNTLLVCAAIPKRNDAGKIGCFHGNILVLSHVSEIIPLFLIDFQYLNGSGINRPLFNRQYKLKLDDQEDANKPLIIPRKYLRKVLNYTTNQMRMFELFKLKFK